MFEMCFKMYGLGVHQYFQSSFNIFDCVVSHRQSPRVTAAGGAAAATVVVSDYGVFANCSLSVFADVFADIDVRSYCVTITA